MISRRNRTGVLKAFSSIVALVQGVAFSGYAQQTSSFEAVERPTERSFTVRGAVQVPGVYRFEHETSLLQLIARAGGLADGHGPFVYVFSAMNGQTESKIDVESYVYLPGSKAAGNQELEAVEGVRYKFGRIHVKLIFDKGVFHHPIMFQSGGIVNVPQGAVFFATGDVRKPGSYRYQVGLTLRQAILLADGTEFETEKRQAIIYRVDLRPGIDGQIVMPLDAVMRGDRDDFVIQPDDIIYVPNPRVGLDRIIPLTHLVDLSQPIGFTPGRP